LQHPLANESSSFFADQAASFAQRGFRNEVEGVQAANCIPVESVRAIENDFGCPKLTLERAAERPAQHDVDSVESRVC
jgi:hypothetical protein